MEPIRTSRLELVAGSLALLDADLQSAEALSELLGASVPSSWPPGEYDRSAIEFFRERLTVCPDSLGWYAWYAIHMAGPSNPRSLVGAGGYLGPPDVDGVVEVG